MNKKLITLFLAAIMTLLSSTALADQPALYKGSYCSGGKIIQFSSYAPYFLLQSSGCLGLCSLDDLHGYRSYSYETEPGGYTLFGAWGIRGHYTTETDSFVVSAPANWAGNYRHCGRP